MEQLQKLCFVRRSPTLEIFIMREEVVADIGASLCESRPLPVEKAL